MSKNYATIQLPPIGANIYVRFSDDDFRRDIVEDHFADDSGFILADGSSCDLCDIVELHVWSS